MVLLSLLVDALAAGSYWLQMTVPALRIVGAILQVVFIVAQLIFMIGYQGPRREKHDYDLKGYRYSTIRYTVIVWSLIINALLLFLYALNLFGGNPIVFGG
ncbi:hypothetical protein [Furfurilactobacillus siliginis]|uniref:Uncharacterized protein n=1 Tax=Furfurilactobacillus siliginis TaxID=348151 RepID=A0A0R2LCJ0_9LACO|nr:hypothetical protein [Furfurilactobacillus siliginis]KRN96908.1 hypothetical protein IV55_GL000780 [Furfurilactobacillus siliginis]GEK28104.1 hypothetical protein LSI01_04150 [Furfurilactobacillus siliginis]